MNAAAVSEATIAAIPEARAVGQSLPRLESALKVNGRGRYTADLELPHMAHARLVRSPYAHARVTRVDAEAALALPGVHLVLSAANIDDYFPNLPAFDPAAHSLPEDIGRPGELHLFGGRVRYAGEPVAAVIAETDDLAREAATLIEVDYEELPAVLDPKSARAAGAPLVHDEIAGNLVAPLTMRLGDPDAALAGTALVLERRFVTQRQKHAQMEPTCCVAAADGNGKVTVWSPNHNPHKIRNALAAMFRLPRHQVRVVVPLIGGSFGKGDALTAEPYTVALALASGRPVKLRFSRLDDFVGTDSRHPTESVLTVGFHEDGTIAALRAWLLVDAGAYAGHSTGVPFVLLRQLLAPYHIAHADITGEAVFTNTQVTGAFRGYGGPQACFPLEHMIDLGCRELGVDPLAVRERMRIRESDVWRADLTIRSDGFGECLERGAQAIDWQEKRERGPVVDGPRRLGVGMACTVWGSGSGSAPGFVEYSGAVVRVNGDGTLTLATAGVDLGTGLRTTLAQICADTFGVPVAAVQLTETDTDVTPYDSGAHASRSLYRNGQAVLAAAADARHRVLEYAADTLEVAAADLDLRDGRIMVRGVPEPAMPLRELVHQALLNDREFFGHGGTTPANAPTFVAQFAEVEVDVETGQVRVLRLITAADVGRAINPSVVEGQLQGAAHQGLGYALSETLLVDRETGTVLNGTFMDYRLLTSLDTPPMEVIIVERPDPSGPFGAKGVGELGIIPTAAAVANAILDATGASVTELPMTPERVLTALRAAPSATMGGAGTRGPDG